MMLYQCLFNSIPKEVKAKTILRQNEYHVLHTSRSSSEKPKLTPELLSYILEAN